MQWRGAKSALASLPRTKRRKVLQGYTLYNLKTIFIIVLLSINRTMELQSRLRTASVHSRLKIKEWTFENTIRYCVKRNDWPSTRCTKAGKLVLWMMESVGAVTVADDNQITLRLIASFIVWSVFRDTRIKGCKSLQIRNVGIYLQVHMALKPRTTWIYKTNVTPGLQKNISYT
jgi:hypothetical protein